MVGTVLNLAALHSQLGKRSDALMHLRAAWALLMAIGDSKTIKSLRVAVTTGFRNLGAQSSDMEPNRGVGV